MPNEHRGEISFGALGRELFVVYGTREIAEAWSALGFRRPDPFQPVAFEEVDGRRVRIGFAERYQRVKDAFDAVFINPDPEALRKCIRCALGRWERQGGTKLSDVEFEQLCDEQGLAGLAKLHFTTYLSALKSSPVEGESAEDSDPNAPSAAPVSLTSSTS